MERRQMRTPNINYIIYFYMFICLTLLFFNIAYIFYMKIADPGAGRLSLSASGTKRNVQIR